ncbi:MAG TPA: SMP-30/gluconolactonase/LRE family protein [Chloroflexota bacterium]|jgi:gluconolactonase|nr:SMP-30/gluconolactonase/LRE family protein [Chloroflexota bacterium]
MRTLSPLEVVVSGYNSPEGPAFDRQGNLHFVNWLSSSIIRVTPDGAAAELANTGGIPAGLAFHRDGTLYVADEGDHLHGILRVSPTVEITPWIQAYQGQPLNGANDLVFDAQGVLYFSDPWRSSLERPIGAFYRAFPDGRLEQLASGLAFPNGVAIDAAGTAVYLAETGRNHVLRFEMRPDGTVGPAAIFARLQGRPGPDGMAFDEAGNLYVAHHGEGRVDVFDPAGREVGRIETPGKETTNVAFGGPERDWLYITEVQTGSVYRIRLDVRGQALFG